MVLLCDADVIDPGVSVTIGDKGLFLVSPRYAVYPSSTEPSINIVALVLGPILARLASSPSTTSAAIFDAAPVRKSYTEDDLAGWLAAVEERDQKKRRSSDDDGPADREPAANDDHGGDDEDEHQPTKRRKDADEETELGIVRSQVAQPQIGKTVDTQMVSVRRLL